MSASGDFSARPGSGLPINGLPSVVVAGHLCLDIFPDLNPLAPSDLPALCRPGRLQQIGPITFSTGGSVANTGLALHRLGIPVRLMGKVGADTLGRVVLEIIRAHRADLADGLFLDAASTTSYSLILSVPGVDRIFWHHPGANDTFCADDIDYAAVAEAAIFHLGYPPLMRRLFSRDGAEMARLFRRVQESGVITTLDMALPDPTSPGGQANWPAIYRAVLPHVDIFLPSLEELLFTLDRPLYQQLLAAGAGDLLSQATPELLSDMGARLLALGVKMVVLKLGARGLYLHTASSSALSGLARPGWLNPQTWGDVGLWQPCFQVQVVGTTGAGDATIAGFLSGLLRGLSPDETVTAALAVGACNVEAHDALSGLRSWEETLARISAGWPRLRAGQGVVG